VFEYLGDRFKDAGYFLFTSFTSTLISVRPAMRSLWRSEAAAPTSARMYDFQIEAESKPALYRELLGALDALTAGEHDGIANMANAAALIAQYLPDLNWSGFYRLVDGELVLGPFQGKAACIRIPLGKGVCGTAAAERRTQLVADVHAFPGHIACDAASRSELVVPITRDGALLGVLDLDSPSPARFDEDDARGCEALMAMLAARL
jgi:GAF domain-containing protein